MEESTTSMCDEAELQTLMHAMQTNAADELARADELIAAHPTDPRLHFLRGSILASIGRSIEAMPALRKAVELAPDFAIARFQLGFFELTSGEAASALSTWGPLALLNEAHYLRRFVAGLTHLIRDEFQATIENLEQGILLNEENPPLNHDMQLIIDRVRSLHESHEPTDQASATSLLLDQFSDRTKLH